MNRIPGFGIVLALGSAALLGGLAVASVQEPGAMVTLEQALKTPAEELAGGYLFLTLTLKMAEIVEQPGNVTVEVITEGQVDTIDETNAAEYVSTLRQTLQIYEEAMRQRGSDTVTGRYDLKATRSCEQFLVTSEPAVLEQDGFKLHLAHGYFQGDARDRGAIVESTVVLESAMSSDVHFVGKVERGRIVLKHRPSRCTLTLVRR